MNTVKIRKMSVQDDAGNAVPHIYFVVQNGMQHGQFCVDDYDTPDGAERAARALAASLEAAPWVSPFKKHEGIILADYGTAGKIRSFVLSLYNGHAFPCDLSNISGMDKKHFGIVIELMTSYHQLGENDSDFMALAEYIKKEFRAKEKTP